MGEFDELLKLEAEKVEAERRAMKSKSQRQHDAALIRGAHPANRQGQRAAERAIKKAGLQ